MPGPVRTLDSIDDVLAALDAVIARAIDERSRVGYFAAIYRKVTAKIAEGIASGLFDDGDQMERFDITFADRYLAALDGYRTGRTVTRSWELAFDAADAKRHIVLQHLLVGAIAQLHHAIGAHPVDLEAPGRAGQVPGVERVRAGVGEAGLGVEGEPEIVGLPAQQGHQADAA